MGTRKHNKPFREEGQTLGDAMRAYAGDCHCDEPEEGETGIIVCTNCALLSFAEEADALFAALGRMDDVASEDITNLSPDMYEVVMVARAAIAKAMGK